MRPPDPPAHPDLDVRHGRARLQHRPVRRDGWSDAGTLGALAAGAAFLAMSVVNEWRADRRSCRYDCLPARERAGACAGRVLFLGDMLGFWFFVTKFLQGVLGCSAVEAGVAFLPTSLVDFVAAYDVPRLTRRFGKALLLAGGLAVATVGIAWLSRLSSDTPYLTGIALPMTLSASARVRWGLPPLQPRTRSVRFRVVNVTHQLGGSSARGMVPVRMAPQPSRLRSDRAWTPQLADIIAPVRTAATGSLGRQQQPIARMRGHWITEGGEGRPSIAVLRARPRTTVRLPPRRGDGKVRSATGRAGFCGPFSPLPVPALRCSMSITCR